MSDFIEVSVPVASPAEENADIIIAFLAEFPLNVFEVEGDLVKAYGPASAAEQLDGMAEMVQPFASGSPQTRFIPKENWNELWEKHYFEPVTIGNRVHIRAAFHPRPDAVEHDIVIQPKMSFGTGHHATTQMMVGLMLELESCFANATVLDMGAGTGVLAIVAEILGATHADAVDIEDWSAKNIGENAEVNGCTRISGFHGDAGFLKGIGANHYHMVLANIHKQVLMEDMAEYARVLKPGGMLVISGFYPEDLRELEGKGCTCGLVTNKHTVLNGWCAAVLVKP